jgi:hypothetical protein
MRYTSRKLIVAIATVALATWLLLDADIAEAMWWNVVQLALGGYFAANVGQKLVDAVTTAVQAKLGIQTPEQPSAAPKP